MSRIRFSISILLFIFLLGSFGFLTYFNYMEYSKMKDSLNKVNQQRIMDKVTSSIKLVSNIDMLFADLVKEDDYIKGLSAYTLEGQNLTEGDTLDDKYKDILTKTARSIGTTRPFVSDDNKYLFMRIDPDDYENTGDELVAVAGLKETSSNFFTDYFHLIINGSVGLGTLLLLWVFVLIFIGVGFTSIRVLTSKLPFAVHKGNTKGLIYKGDREVKRLVETFSNTIGELNDIHGLLERLSKYRTKGQLLRNMFGFLEGKGLKSIVVIYKTGDVFKTLFYKGAWKDSESIENFSINIDKINETTTMLLNNLVKNQAYAEITQENKNEYSELDVELFGVPSIYMPVASEEGVELVIGGYGSLEQSMKRAFALLTTRWGSILLGIIKSTIEKEEIEEKLTKTSKTQSTAKKSIEKNIKEEDERKLFKERRKNVVNKINDKTEQINKQYRKGVELGKAKRYNEALDQLLPLLDIKKDAKLLKMIGTLYYNLKDYENACGYWEEALDNDPSDDSIKKLLKKGWDKLEG